MSAKDVQKHCCDESTVKGNYVDEIDQDMHALSAS